MSFAEVCAGQLSQSPETQTAAPATALASTPSVQTGDKTANAPAPKNPAKNAPAAGASPVLAFLVPLPPLPLAIPVNTLTSSRAQPVESFLSVDSTNQAASGSNGNIQSTNLSAATTITTALTSENISGAGTTTPVPSLVPVAVPSLEAPAFTSAPAQIPWSLSSASGATPVSASNSSRPSSLIAPSLPPNGIGAQDPTFQSTPTDAPGDEASQEIVPATRTTFDLNAETPPWVTSTTAEVPSFIPDTHAPLPPIDAEQASLNQAPTAPVSPAVVQILAPPEAGSDNGIQAAVISSSQPEQAGPADQKGQPRSQMQPRSPFDPPTSHPSSVTGTSILGTSAAGTSVPGALPANSTVTATSLASHTALAGTQRFPSAAASPIPAHEISSATLATSVGATPPTLSTVQDNLNNAHQPANVSVSASGTEASAASAASSSPASSSKKDSGGQSSDPDQHKDSPNTVATAADSLPTIASPAFTLAAPSAQGSVPQPPSAPNAGSKANPQTSTGSSANAPRASLPVTADPLPTAGASPLQWAQIANKAGQAEMRIGLNTAEFGSVEVRTTVHASDVGVLIGSEKGDLRSLLTPELPGIANTLQQQDLRLAQVSFHQPGFDFAGNSSFSGGNSQPRSFSARPQPAVASSEASSASEPARPFEPTMSRRSSGLNILA